MLGTCLTPAASSERTLAYILNTLTLVCSSAQVIPGITRHTLLRQVCDTRRHFSAFTILTITHVLGTRRECFVISRLAVVACFFTMNLAVETNNTVTSLTRTLVHFAITLGDLTRWRVASSWTFRTLRSAL